MKQNLLVFTLFLILGVALRAEPCRTQEGTPLGKGVEMPKRVAIITPALFDNITPQVKEWLENLQKEKRRKTTDKEPKGKQKFDRLQQGKPASTAHTLPFSDTLLLEYAYRLFPRYFEARAMRNRSVETIPTERVQEAIRKLNLTREECFTPLGAKRLSEALDSAEILLVREAQYTLRDATERVLVFRATLWEGEKPHALCGTATAERSVLSGAYSQAIPMLMARAVARAANRWEHTMRLGNAMPLLEPETKIALFPIPAPTTADRLLFTPMGRAYQPNSLQGLPKRAEGLFHPNLLPLSSASIFSAGVVERELKIINIALENLWNQAGGLNAEGVQEIGKRLKVDYLLMARVVHLEVAGTLPKSTTPLPVALQQEDTASEVIFQTRAEANALLVRVSDGVVLWQEREEASLALRADQLVNTLLPTERTMVQNTTRFALLRLEQSLQRYLASYED